MKYSNSILSISAAFLLAATLSLEAQQQPGGATPDQQQGQGPRGGQGRGRGGRGGFFGPQLPPEQQAEVDRINAALEAETKAITVANSNLVVATFSTPADKDKIAQANEELTKAREAWTTKASKLFAETQASDKKLSEDAINRLVMMSSGGGRGGRGFGPGGFGRGGFGPGGPGGAEGRGGAGGGRRGAGDRQ